MGCRPQAAGVVPVHALCRGGWQSALCWRSAHGSVGRLRFEGTIAIVPYGCRKHTAGENSRQMFFCTKMIEKGMGL